MFRAIFPFCAALMAFAALTMVRAEAIPVFAHRFNLTCQACHTEVPHLTAFGKAFAADGYRIPGIKPKPAFPISMRVEVDYASAGAADPDDIKGPLPKTIVNEVEFLMGGSVGTRASYWLEPYLVDGGFPGVVRDAWFAERLTPDGANFPLLVRAGQFTLPLPLDPETFRETTQPYGIWSQTAGGNPFTFFDTKQGVELEAGDPGRQIGATLSALKGADTQSGLPSYGVDTMATLERDVGNFKITAYRYDGSRPLEGPAFNNTQFFTNVYDRFWRNGFGLGWAHNRTEIDGVYQNGNDTAADVYGDPLLTSGGFFQVRQALGSRAFAIARWDATNGVTFSRSITGGAGYRLSRNTRLTLFETGERDFNGNLLHIISSSLLFAY
jgi:hypothetical protein